MICIGASPAERKSSICRCSEKPWTKYRLESPPESVPKPSRTPASVIFLTLSLSISNARSISARLASLACSARLPASFASCSEVSARRKNGSSVKPGASLPKTNIPSSRASVEITLTFFRLRVAMKVSGNLLVANIVDKKIHALVHDCPRVGKFDDVGHRELAVFAGLIHHRGIDVARQLRPPAALAVDPDFDEVGALGDDVVDPGAGLCRRFRLRARDEGRRHEAILHA